MRLIDAEELYRVMKKDIDKNSDKYRGFQMDGMLRVCGYAVKEAPPIDAIPVKWIMEWATRYPELVSETIFAWMLEDWRKEQHAVGGVWRHYEGMLTCSECGTTFYDDIMEYLGDEVPRYCPYCGTKMDGDKHEVD